MVLDIIYMKSNVSSEGCSLSYFISSRAVWTSTTKATILQQMTSQASVARIPTTTTWAHISQCGYTAVVALLNGSTCFYADYATFLDILATVDKRTVI